MKTFFVTVLALLGAASMTRGGWSDDVCNGKVPSCVRENTIQECSTCCCVSSENAEFFNGSDVTCTAPPAIYQVTLNYTLNEICQPDINNEGSGWSRPSVISHSSGYRMWDACMEFVSNGVATFSQTGDLSLLLVEGVAEAVARMTAIDTPIFDGDSIQTGSGTTSINLVVDQDHPYVSSLIRLVPSPDYVVGVDSLRLCDGDKWKESVKVCFELFSTAAASERVAPEMMRNSVQNNSCSFGYVEFNLIKAQILYPRTPLNDICYPQIPEECPAGGPSDDCPTCCCESSDNVEFYDPDAPEPECTAPPTTYEMTFNFNWNEVCHPGNFESYSIFQPVWSWPIGVSHNTKYRMWDACMDNVSIGVGLVSQIGLTGVLVMEFMAAADDILDYAIGGTLQPPTSQFSQNLSVNSDHQWVSALSNRGPTPDQIVGVADLRLCDGDKWKENVKICFELFSTAAASERVAPEMMRNSVQGNNCSFGYLEFKNQETESSAEGVTIGVTMPTIVAFIALYL